MHTLPYLGMVGKFRCDDPPFWEFSIRLGPYFIPQQNLIDTLFLQKKIGLSLSHLVPEILGPKIGQFFHQNVFLKILSILYQFSLNLQSN